MEVLQSLVGEMGREDMTERMSVVKLKLSEKDKASVEKPKRSEEDNVEVYLTTFKTSAEKPKLSKLLEEDNMEPSFTTFKESAEKASAEKPKRMSAEKPKLSEENNVEAYFTTFKQLMWVLEVEHR